MSDYIRDAVTGRQLAWIDNNGAVFNEAGQKCAIRRDGELHSLDGNRASWHLQPLGASIGEETPPALLRLLDG